VSPLRALSTLRICLPANVLNSCGVSMSFVCPAHRRERREVSVMERTATHRPCVLRCASTCMAEGTGLYSAWVKRGWSLCSPGSIPPNRSATATCAQGAPPPPSRSIRQPPPRVSTPLRKLVSCMNSAPTSLALAWRGHPRGAHPSHMRMLRPPAPCVRAPRRVEHGGVAVACVLTRPATTTRVFEGLS
jgi:hypothetical protein